MTMDKLDKIAAFDTLYTNNHIQILKLLLPSIPKDKQYFGIIFIKFLELKYVIEFGKNLISHSGFQNNTETDYNLLCDDILPFCNSDEAKTVESVKSILQTFETFKNLSPVLDLIRQMNNSQTEDGNSFDFSSIMNMSGPFSQDMDFDMLKNLAGSFMGDGNSGISDE